MKQPHNPDFTIDSVISSSQGEIISQDPPGMVSPPVPRMFEEQDVFNKAGYLEGRAPYALHGVHTGALNQVYPRCLDMPLRLAGQTVYSLPEEWKQLSGLIRTLINTEHVNNFSWQEYNTYLTVDCTYVQPDEQQRHGGLHVDGFQGSRIVEKNKITRNYVMTTNGGTRFYPQPFVVVDETKFNVFQGFDLQAKDYVIADEHQAYFMDAYTVHESGIANREGLRTFLRLTYDVKKFDRLGNTHNSMLDYDWEMYDRRVHDTVLTPTMDDVAYAALDILTAAPHRLERINS